MFNLVFFTSAYVLFGRAGGGGYRAYHISMAVLLLLLIVRYILFSASLASAWYEWEGGRKILSFVPFFRYYRFGALSGSAGIGIAAAVMPLLWLICLLTLRGNIVFAVTSTISLFTDAVLSLLFASRAERPRVLPVILSALGLNFAAVWFINHEG